MSDEADEASPSQSLGDQWVPVPVELRAILHRKLEREFAPDPVTGQLSEDAQTFGRLLIRSSLFFPGEELEQAKNLAHPENAPPPRNSPEASKAVSTSSIGLPTNMGVPPSDDQDHDVGRDDVLVQHQPPGGSASPQLPLSPPLSPLSAVPSTGLSGSGLIRRASEIRELDEATLRELEEELSPHSGDGGRNANEGSKDHDENDSKEDEDDSSTSKEDDNEAHSGMKKGPDEGEDSKEPENKNDSNPKKLEQQQPRISTNPRITNHLQKRSSTARFDGANRQVWVAFFEQELGSLGLQRGADSPVVIFVLGPSAAGKTHGCKLLLASPAFPKNLGTFVSVDGAAMRGCSKTWVEFSIHVAPRRYRIQGFSDLYEGYFRPYLESLKLCFTQAVVKGRYSCIVPHTARDAAKFCKNYVDAFASENYVLQVMAVVASAKRCLENGRSREKVRGKQYSDKYHEASVRAVRSVVNYCHERAREPGPARSRSESRSERSFRLFPTQIQHASCWCCPVMQEVPTDTTLKNEVTLGASPVMVRENEDSEEGDADHVVCKLVCTDPGRHTPEEQAPIYS